MALAALLALVLGRRIRDAVDRRYERRIHAITIQSLELVQAGRIHAAVHGMVDGLRAVIVLGLAIAWLVQVPFDVFDLWWQRRHDLSRVGYFEAVFGGWFELGAEFLFLCFALLVVMALARWIGRGAPFSAIPVFPHRKFCHGNVLIHAASGIQKPEDFAGKIIGMRAHFNPVSLWMRGVLQEDYGVTARSLRLRTKFARRSTAFWR